MTSCKTVMVTSCKGGVGKSTVSAGIALALGRRGRRILLIDLDLGMRCLDLILGCEDKAIYDIADAVCDGVPLERVAVDAGKNVRFCAAPFRKNTDMDESRFRAFTDGCKESFDYIIIDTPGDIGKPFALAAAVSDAALITATHSPSSVRAAEHTGRELEKLGVKNSRLVVNCFDTSDTRRISRGQRLGLIDIIDKTYLQLIGVVPYDADFAFEQEHGRQADPKKSQNVVAAVDNIAARMDGEQIAVFNNFKKISRKKLM